MAPDRRSSDGLRAIDGLLGNQLQQPALDGRALANLAVAMATEYSGARRGTLLLDEGEGLAPVLALGPELTAAAKDRSAYDPQLVERVQGSLQTEQRKGRLAVPVLFGGALRGVLYLEAEAEFAAAERLLAETAAGRIASALRSAEMVDELARRKRNLELLEALSSALTTGRLGRRHLGQTLDAALAATASDEGLLALVAPGSGLDELIQRGGEGSDLEAAARRLESELRAGVAVPDAARGSDRPTLLAPLNRQITLATERGKGDELIGFLTVRRLRAKAYDEMDRNFFRALANLVTGAIERRDYFRRAAEDPVTGTGSRLALQLTLAQLQANADRTGEPFSVIVLDVDNFKEINDRHGHPEGDRVLRSLAETLRGRLRDQDFLARYGGDEFVVLLPATDASGARELAEDLRQRASRDTLAPAGMELSVSLGVVTYPAHARELSTLLDLGDRALYASKTAGRNRVTVAATDRTD